MYSDKPADRLLAAGSTKAAGSADIVLEALYDLIAVSEDGARLPTVRDLMRRYQVSQAVVQGAVGKLRGQGLLTSQVGRGTYVVKGGAAAMVGAGWRWD